MADKGKGQRSPALAPMTSTTAKAAQSVDQHSGAADTPVVVGLVYGPCPGRRRYLILVRRCCWCGYAHRHTSELLADTYSRGCPPTGRRYRVRTRVERDTRAVIRHAV